MEKREGPIHALNEVKELTGSIPMTNDLPKFTVAGEKIDPKMNLYSSESKEIKTYTYPLGDKKNVKLYSYFGIPDNEDFKGELIIMADGKQILQYNKQVEPVYIPFDTVNEITITLKGNAKLWDAKFTEMKHWWE